VTGVAIPEASPKAASTLIRNVGYLDFGRGSLDALSVRLKAHRARAGATGDPTHAVYLVDGFFTQVPRTLARLGVTSDDYLHVVDTTNEPTTNGIDDLVLELGKHGFGKPAAIVALGGGATLDTAKAISTLLTNGGKAADYQGWDLVKVPAVPKIGIPTVSGTGAEATRTCVLTNSQRGIKLGINSDYSVFDHVIMDPDLQHFLPRSEPMPNLPQV
jgi:3-deoxy-alpha-D-manno-octulosonate 8-oxidase